MSSSVLFCTLRTLKGRGAIKAGRVCRVHSFLLYQFSSPTISSVLSIHFSASFFSRLLF